MIAAANNNTAVMPRVMTAASKSNETETQKQNLQNRSAHLRELMKNSPDTVEISDKARALAAAVFNKTTVPDADKPAAADSSSPVNTREERAQTAKDYNKILEDLRTEYGEEEAMRRFDKFMKDEGYELVTEDNSNGLFPSGMRFQHGFSAGVTLPPNGQRLSFSNLQSYSSIKGAMGADGEVGYVANTYVNYAGTTSREVQDALDSVYEKNMTAAQKGASFDLREYMTENFGQNNRTSAVSASTELGTLAQNLLKEAGVELGADERVNFGPNEDGSLYVSGPFDEAEQEAIDAALKRNPGIAKAFKAEYNSVAMTDTSGLAGEYSDGARSVEYGAARRSFVFSGSEPSAVVMTDSIDVRSSGYNYQKKVSDSFDVNADNRMASDGGVNLVSLDFEYNQKVNKALQDKLNEAAASGEAIESTITQAEYNSIQKARGGPNADGFALGLPRDANGKEIVPKLYYAAGSPEAEKQAAEAEQALRDLASDPERGNAEIAYVDERREARKATAAQLLEMFQARRNAPGTEMIASIMDALARLRG